MKKNIVLTMIATTLIMGLILAGCSFGPEGSNPTPAAGKGFVQFKLGAAGSRTLLPAEFAFDKFTLTFTDEGSSDTVFDQDAKELTDRFELTAGTYSLSAEFFDDDDNLIATASEDGIVVPDGAYAYVTLSVVFEVADPNLKGTIDGDIELEDDLESALFTLIDLSTGTAITLNLLDEDATVPAILEPGETPAGYYLVTVTLTKREGGDENTLGALRTAVYSDVLHVYPSQTTLLKLNASNFTFAALPIVKVGNTLVDNSPLITAGGNFTGSIVGGTVTFTAGQMDYVFPTEAEDGPIDIDEYAWFTLDFTLHSPGGTSAVGSMLKQLRSGTNYAAVGTAVNAFPWLSSTNEFQKLPVAGAGVSDGISIQYNGTGPISLTFNKITFHKVPLRSVTFDGNGAETSDPQPVEVWDTFYLGTNLPAAPELTDYTFLGWQNDDGDTVNSTTPITGDWLLTAQWILTADLPLPSLEAPANGTLFSDLFSSTPTMTTLEYQGKQWWVMAKTPPGTPAAVAPFDSADAEVYTSALAKVTALYTRIAFRLPTLTSGAEWVGPAWTSYSKVTITYDLIVVGGNDLAFTVRNNTGAGGDNIVENQTVVAGEGQTLTYNVSDFTSGNLAIVKRNSGSDTLLLFRITKIELGFDD